MTAADGESAVLRDVERGRVHTLAADPGLAVGDVLRGTLAADPPLEVTWTVAEETERWSVAVEVLEESPDDAEREAAADLADGEGTTLERSGGETDVLAVPPARTAAAAREVAEDQATLTRAARLGVERVDVAAAEGVVAVRYGVATR